MNNLLDDGHSGEHEERSFMTLHPSIRNVIRIGTSVNSEDEAYNCYNEYAINMGFSIRKHVFRRNKDGKITSRTFVCSKQGASTSESETRLDTRTMCKTSIKFKEERGLWSVVNFDEEHNHEMVVEDEKHLLRSARKIEQADAAVISSMVDAGFRATQTFSYLANEKGGEIKVQFTLEDLNNHIHTKRKTQLEAGDAQSLINHFCKERQNDPMFFYAMQLDDDSHMANFFWRDGKSMIDYEHFGDVFSIIA